MLAALGLLSVAVSWFTVHTIFALRYALLYYADPEGGVDFNQDEPPCYRDFAYLAMTVGTTFQVSDTDLHTTGIRVTVLRHCAAVVPVRRGNSGRDHQPHRQPVTRRGGLRVPACPASRRART